jgi:uncharacterized protein
MLPAIGIAIRDQNRDCLNDASINAGEITVDSTAGPLKFENHFRSDEFDVVSIYARRLCVATAEPVCRSCLDNLKAIADQNGAHSIAGRLGFDTDVSIDAVSVLRSPRFVDTVCRTVDSLHRIFGRTRFFLENCAGLALTADVLAQILEKAGCGWMLDVTSVYTDSRNLGYDPYDFIAEVLPAATRVQIHLSGGDFDKRAGEYRDTHSQSVPEEVWSLYRHALVLGGHKTQAVFIERDRNFPASEGWRNEVRHARFLAERVHCRQRMMRSSAVARRA